jgi:hypothetical protein
MQIPSMLIGPKLDPSAGNLETWGQTGCSPLIPNAYLLLSSSPAASKAVHLAHNSFFF